jgi:uncharacterized protein
MHQPRFEIIEDKRHQFCFHLAAGNGRIILQSESYKKIDMCRHGIEAVKQNAANIRQFKLKPEGKAKTSPYFVLTASNGEVIARSETYSSVQKRDVAVKTVMRVAPTALVETVAIPQHLRMHRTH